MRAIAPEIESLGARLAFIGNGTPQHAAWFVEDFAIAEPVLADPERLTYRALDARRAGLRPGDLRSIWYGLRAWRAGYRQTETRGDARQLGAVAIVRPGGELAWTYRSAAAGDHPSPERVLSALREVVGG